MNTLYPVVYLRGTTLTKMIFPQITLWKIHFSYWKMCLRHVEIDQTLYLLLSRKVESVLDL